MLTGLLLAGWLGSSAAQAQFPEDEEESSAIHTHDGFLARLTVGPAAGVIAEQAAIAELRDGESAINNAQLDVSGAGYALSLDAGYALSPSFALHARLSQWVLPAPELDGESPEGRGDSTRTLALFAPGLSWF